MAQRLFDLIDRERSHLDGLGEQPVSSVSLQFEYLDMPPEPGTVGRARRYLQVVVAELLHDLRDAGHRHEVPDGGDIEHEHAAGIEMPVCTAEKALPRREAEQVIDTLIRADDSVESGAEREAGHIGEVQRHVPGEFPARHGEHAGCYI